jgi:hypothetical protein
MRAHARSATIRASLMAVAVSACGSTTGDEPIGPAPVRTTIEGHQGAYVGYDPAELKATFGSMPTYELTFTGARGGEVWSAIVRLRAEDVRPGLIKAAVEAAPLAEGKATVQVRPQGALLWGQTGQIALSLAKGHFSGSAEIQPESLAATFSGDLVVSCWVPRTDLPNAQQPGGGTIGNDGSVALVADADFQSARCSGLKALAP